MTTISFEGQELRTKITPSAISDYVKPVFSCEGDKLWVGYLTDDQDCENPLTACDGYGMIYSAHRHAPQEHKAAMQKALGLDSDGQPELNGLLESINNAPPDASRKLTQYFRRQWVKTACQDAFFQEWAKEYVAAPESKDVFLYRKRAMLMKLGMESASEVGRLLLTEGVDIEDLRANEIAENSTFQRWCDKQSLSEDAFIKLAAMRVWSDFRRGNFDHDRVDTTPLDFDAGNAALRHVFGEARKMGLHGNRFAVVLDCYSHSGEHWSISGQGTQCRWDTAKGAGVWVPDDCAKEEIERRAKVYAYGSVQSNGTWTAASGKRRWTATLDATAEVSPEFLEWHDAFSWLEAAKKPSVADLALGIRRGAIELAESALGEYNEWLAGSCYGIVEAEYTRTAGGKWQLDKSEVDWGCIGSESAEEEMRSRIPSKDQTTPRKAA